MKQLPSDVKRIPFEKLGALVLDAGAIKEYAWTTVQGTPKTQIQATEGMFKGQTQYIISFICPRCEDTQSISSSVEHGAHPTRCYCDGTLVFLVQW
jgi:uncharacterized protein YjaZ